MKYEEYKQKEQSKLITSCYYTFRGEQELDFLSDSLLFEVCRSWVEQGSELNFEDFVDYYLECGEEP